MTFQIIGSGNGEYEEGISNQLQNPETIFDWRKMNNTGFSNSVKSHFGLKHV